MRGGGRGRGAGGVALGLLAATALAWGGCTWSAKSGLPEHIRTVSVPMFANATTHYSIETRLTQALRRGVIQDGRLKLVNEGGDAVLSGRIVSVDRRAIRDNRDDLPATMQLVVNAEYSFYDEQAKRYLAQEARIDSSQAGSARGLYEVDRDPRKTPEDAAMDSAIDSLAAEIIRRTLAMW